MTKKFPFAKMSGADNDFILVDAAHLRGISLPGLARRLCPRRQSVGADGLLVVTRGAKPRGPRLDYYNADGSRAFCGNGLRCAAWWMHQSGWVGRRFSIDSIHGSIESRITRAQRVRIRMPDARGLRLGMRLKAGGKTFSVDTIDTGVPHAVVRVRKLDGFPVFEVGRALRRSSAFNPAGTNVNFALMDGSPIRIRTYERGVEEETLACGTGAVASAVLTAVRTGRKSPITVVTRGGPLKIGFTRASKTLFTGIWLEGPARIVYQGEVTA